MCQRGRELLFLFEQAAYRKAGPCAQTVIECLVPRLTGVT